MTIEETGVESAHVAIGDTAAVKDVLSGHLVSGDASPVFVDMLRLMPVIRRDLSEFDFGIRQVGYSSIDDGIRIALRLKSI